MLSVADARALITTSLSDADLAEVITREEAWLARRIGPLQGGRTESFVAPDGDEVLRLQRPARDLTIVDEGGAVTDYEHRGWSDVVRTAGSWSTPVDVAYTADDEDEVTRALVTLVRLTLTEQGYQAESTQGYSYAADGEERRRQRHAAWRSLLRPRLPRSVRITSAIPAGGRTVESVRAVAVAS